MKKWVRWPGLLAFVVVVGLLAGSFILFSGLWIARGIEAAGTLAVGARVDVGGARLGIFPLSLRLSEVAVTDPEAPMTNAVEAAAVRMRLDTGRLMMGKVDISEMAVDGVRFGSPRKFSGALPDAEKKQKGKGEEASGSFADRFSIPSLQMPDVGVILARERLASLEEAKALEAELRAEQAAFEKRLQGLPDGQTLNAYGARMEKLKKKSGLEGILSGAKELQEIHADLDRDMRNLRAMKEDLDKRRAELTQRILSLKDLVSEDIARLVEKYSLSDKGVGNITGLLLGPEWEMRIRKGLAVYRKLAPLLAKIPAGGETGKTEPEKRKRGEGLDRRFAETPPRPDFLIREARLSLHLSAGDLKGVLRNVTGQQALAGSPMTLELEGRPFSGADAVHMTAVFNRMRPASPEDRFRIGMEGWRPGTLGGGGLTLSAEKGVMEMDAVMGKGGLSGNMRMDLTGLHFVSVEVAGDAGPVLISALKDVRTLDVRVEMSGKPDQPVLRFSSSLDKVVKDAVSRIVRETAEAFRVRVDREVRMLSQEKFLEMDAGMRALAVVDSGLEERIAVVRRLAAKK